MTDPSEVVVSDAEIDRILSALGVPWSKGAHELCYQELAVLIAKRVPGTSTERDDINDESGMFTNGFGAGFNACRERVLTGK